jgi:hypothetical protein
MQGKGWLRALRRCAQNGTLTSFTLSATCDGSSEVVDSILGYVR